MLGRVSIHKFQEFAHLLEAAVRHLWPPWLRESWLIESESSQTMVLGPDEEGSGAKSLSRENKGMFSLDPRSGRNSFTHQKEGLEAKPFWGAQADTK